MAHEDKYGINRRGVFMRQYTLAATGVALAALLSSVPAMAQVTNQAYNTDNIGWNRGGTYIIDTKGTVPQCFKTETGKFDGPQLTGSSDAATIAGKIIGVPALGQRLLPNHRGRPPATSTGSASTFLNGLVAIPKKRCQHDVVELFAP
jgi:hypothetical protein